MKELLRNILKSLVQEEDKIEIEMDESTPGLIAISVNVASGDVGRVIGKGGSIATSIRTILKASSPKLGDNRAVTFEVIEPTISNWNPDLRDEE